MRVKQHFKRLLGMGCVVCTHIRLQPCKTGTSRLYSKPRKPCFSTISMTCLVLSPPPPPLPLPWIPEKCITKLGSLYILFVGIRKITAAWHRPAFWPRPAARLRASCFLVTAPGDVSPTKWLQSEGPPLRLQSTFPECTFFRCGSSWN